MPRPPATKKAAGGGAEPEDDGAEFNPAFRFDLGPSSSSFGAAAPAWQFSDALQAALRDKPATGTSLDAKIEGRLQQRDLERERRAEAKKRARALPPPPPGAPPKKARRAAEDEDDDEDDDEDGDDDEDLMDDDDEDEDLEEEDSEEALLPGEAEDDEDDDDEDDDEDDGSDDDDDEEEEEELDDDDEDDEVMEDEESEEEPAAPAKPKAVATPTKAAAAAAKPAKPAPPSPPPSANANANANINDDHNGFYAPAPEGTAYAARAFADLNLSRPLLRAVDSLGYSSPTPIQAAVVPVALAGRDVCASAVTGSGKTAAFALPFLERLLHRPRHGPGAAGSTYVLVLAPARELAVQVHSMVSALAQHTDVRVALAVGGLSLQAQAAELRRGAEVVVATPGRAVDHLRNTPCFGLEELAVLVLDEADRLLEMGFADEVREVVRAAPKSRQTLLFSATFNEDVRALADLSLRSPVRLAADPAAAAPLRLRQEVVRLRGPAQAARREAALLCLCSRPWFSAAGAGAEDDENKKANKKGKAAKDGGNDTDPQPDASSAAARNGGRTIVFFRTKARAHRARILFGLARLPPAAELHGDMTQAQRLEALERFRRGEAAFLLATDVASRGLDIPGVRAVVNADCPRTLETYLHRVGRTARAGRDGAAVTLADDNDRALLKAVVKKAGANLQQRALPALSVAAWHGKIEKLEPDVRRVLDEERHEASLRRAEMEAQRAANLLEHEEEIAARPARTWFQTGKEKAASRERAKAAALGGGGKGLGSAFGNADSNAASDADPSKAAAAAAANKARRREDDKAKKRAAAAERDGGPPTRGKGALAEATEAQVPKAKSVKSRARQLVQQGVPAAQATRIAAAAVSGVGTKKQKKQQQKEAGGGGGGGGGGLFSGDGAGGSSSSAASSGKRASRAGLSRSEINRLRRGGKGAKAFKSKGRFKSRYKKRGKR